jgi:hypothetical protein
MVQIDDTWSGAKKQTIPNCLQGSRAKRLRGRTVPVRLESLFPEVLAIALALLVLPAWKWFILPMPHGPHGSHGVDDHTPKIPRGGVKDEAQTSSKHRFFGRIGSSMSSLGETEMRRKFTQGFSTLSREDSVNLLTA